MLLIRILFWVQAFAGPVILFGLLAFIVFNQGDQYKGIAIGLLTAGVMAEIILAEWIRRKYGRNLF